MSMLRCLYGRLKLVKCALGEPGKSSICLKVTHHQSVCQYIVKVNVRNLHGMTCDKKKTEEPGSSDDAERKAGGSLVRNGLIVDSALRSPGAFISNGYYRTEWGQQGTRGETNGERAHRGNTSKCEFDLNFINVRLLGLLGTAVAVGINVNSHINDWMPYQNRGIHDLCQYQYHRKFLNPSLISPTAETECDDSQSSLSRAIECLHAKPFSNCTICKIDANTSSPTTTISCCGSCRSCSDLLNKILHLYAIFPSGSASTSIASSIFNVLPRSSRHSVLPSVVYKADSSNENDHQYADEVDGNAVGIDLTSTTGLRRLQYDSISSSDAFNQRRTSLVPLQKTEQQPVEKELSFPSRQRKKSIFNISEEETEQLQQLANEKTTSSSQTSKSDYISLSASSTESSVSTEEAKSVDHKVTTPQKSAKSSSSTEDEQDIVTIFRLASMEYYEKLNNIMAVSLMDTEPDEAMQCWSSCEASSRAFFNMGVAYESGRHAKRAKPDFVQAHDCYALAASMGHRDAIFNLALFYLYGDRNVEVNLDYGYKLLQAAAEKGVLAAKNFITEARRTQFIDDLRESLQKTQSRVDVLKRRPERTSQSYGRPSRPALRPTPSLIGPSRTQLKMKQSTAVGEGVLDDITASATLKRSTSSPNFLTLNNDSASRNAMATVQ